MPSLHRRRWSPRSIRPAVIMVCAITVQILVFIKHSEISAPVALGGAGVGAVLLLFALRMTVLAPPARL
ncbi:hypothetical protein ACIGO9_29615 [Nocardia asteroides]|uniref:hypothetical protein n=1 Tax=Nocardia asteroides TaxID=1824 RepID=UPI0037C56B64